MTYHGGEVSAEEGLDRLEKHRIRAAIKTSASHTTDKPRWHVFAPLSIALLKDHHDRLLRRLNGALGGILSSESFTLSQTYYTGKINGHPYECLTTFDDPGDGVCIDELNELDAIAVGPPRASSTQEGDIAHDADLRTAILTGENFHEALRSLSARFAGARHGTD